MFHSTHTHTYPLSGKVLCWELGVSLLFPGFSVPWIREGRTRPRDMLCILRVRAAAVSISAARGREYSLRTGVGSCWGWDL